MAAAAVWLVNRGAMGQTFTVNTASGTGPGTLGSAIQQANAYGNGATINFQNNLGTINAGVLPAIDVGLTINGGIGNSVSGQNAHRIFFVDAPGQSVVIESITLTAGFAQGGAGGSGGGAGGGGAGLGGALFVNAGAVSLQSVSFTGNAAMGGAGGNGSFAGGGGGGGLDYSGGAGNTGIVLNGTYYYEGSGGGGGAHTSAGGNGNGFGAGSGGGVKGGAANTSASGPDGGGGGGVVDTSAGNPNGYQSPSGGGGLDFGGGGGGAGSINNFAGNGGGGGFGGGGGGGGDAGSSLAGNGGNGGFGGGGGGGGGTPNEIYYGPTVYGIGGFLGGVGGDGNEGAGGGGAGLGGAIFVRSTNGASVSLIDTSTDAGTVTGGGGGISPLGGGSNGTGGGAAGSALFLMGGTTSFTVDAGKTETIAGSIDQSQAASISMNGGGVLVLSGNNGGAAGYSGGTIINGGELSVSADDNLGYSASGLTLNGGSLQVTGSSYQSTSRVVTLGGNGGGFDIVNPTNVFNVSRGIAGSGGLTKLGLGTLALDAASSYTGVTTVSNGTLELGYSYDGEIATLPPSNIINVSAAGTLVLGSANGQTNVLGSGANAPNVSIPSINLSGGTLTNYAGTTHNVGQIYLAGGTISGSSTTYSIFYDLTFNSVINVNASVLNSYITAAGGIALRGSVPFNVSAGTGSLIVTAALHDEPNETGGVTKNSAGQMILENTDTYSAGTIVNAGSLVFDGAGTSPLNSALTVNGGTAEFVNLAGGTRFLSQLNSLSFGGSTNAWTGKVDLTNNDLIIHTGSLADLTNQAREGFSNGTWNGSAGIVSSAAAADSLHLTAVAVVQNNQSGSALFTGGNTFDGVAPAPGDLLLKYTYYGDANLNGVVDGSDYSRIDTAYLADKTNAGKYTGWYNGDFNYDGVVNGSDYTLIDDAFNTQFASLAGAVDPTANVTSEISIAAVPEPQCLSIMAVAAGAMLGRRRSLQLRPGMRSAA